MSRLVGNDLAIVAGGEGNWGEKANLLWDLGTAASDLWMGSVTGIEF